jgi:hypothetical protein
MEVSGQLHITATFCQPPFDKKLGGPQSQVGCCGKEKNLLSLPLIVSQFLGSFE